MLFKVGVILCLMIVISFCQESVSVKLFCRSGLIFTKYETETQECNNGEVLDRRNVRPLVVPLTTNFNSTSIILQDDRSTINTSLSIVTLTCNGRTFSTYTNKKGTVGCCGPLAYHPNKQTCCQRTSNEYKIHYNKPERNHVCCGVQVFARRSTKLPCQHGSRNEALMSSKLPTLRKMYPVWSSTKIEICSKKFVFYVKITGKEEKKDRRNLVINVTQYEWNGLYLRRVHMKKNIEAPLDKYSQKWLKRKTFVIFSNYEYLDDVVFYRHDRDAVFKASRRKHFVLKKVRKLLNTC